MSLGNKPIRIIIPLPPVTKKNSQRIIYAGGRPKVLPSEKYQEWENEAGYFLHGNQWKRISEPVNVCCRFYMPTRRRVDLNNLLEAVTDMLVRYRVVEDDNSRIVAGHDGSRVLYDKEHPRTVIEIWRMSECSDDLKP